jgi:hypothetical protein
MITPRLCLSKFERAVVSITAFGSLGVAAVAGAEVASAPAKTKVADYPVDVVKTLDAAIKGHVVEPKHDGGNVYFGYEQVQYFSDGSRDVTFYGTHKDLVQGAAAIDEFDENCSKNTSSVKPGHTLDAVDLYDRNIGQHTPGSAYCADERLTPEAFVDDPLTLGVPGFVVLNR